MSTSEKVVIAIVLFALTIAVVLLALTARRLSASTPDRATVVVHADALRLHGDRLTTLWREQERLGRRLAALEHAADRAGDGR